MLDIVLEFVVTKHKSRYLLAYFLLFIACIPWITVLPMIPNLRIPDDVLYMLRFMPLIRSCYALAIVVGWFTFRRSSALFMTTRRGRKGNRPKMADSAKSLLRKTAPGKWSAQLPKTIKYSGFQAIMDIIVKLR